MVHLELCLEYLKAVVKASKSDSFNQQTAMLFNFGCLTGLPVLGLGLHVISLPLLRGLVRASI